MSYTADFVRRELPRDSETAARELAAQFRDDVAAGKIAPGSPAAAIVWAVGEVDRLSAIVDRSRTLLGEERQ